MEQVTKESEPTNEQEKNGPKPEDDSYPGQPTGTEAGVYAVIAHKETGEVRTVRTRNKNNMTKLLGCYGDMWALLAVFKGKQLMVKKDIRVLLE